MCVCAWFLELNAFDHVLGIDTFWGITGEVPFDPLLLRRHFRCFDLLSIWDRGAPQESRGVPLTSLFHPKAFASRAFRFKSARPFLKDLRETRIREAIFGCAIAFEPDSYPWNSSSGSVSPQHPALSSGVSSGNGSTWPGGRNTEPGFTDREGVQARDKHRFFWFGARLKKFFFFFSNKQIWTLFLGQAWGNFSYGFSLGFDLRTCKPFETRSNQGQPDGALDVAPNGALAWREAGALRALRDPNRDLHGLGQRL